MTENKRLPMGDVEVYPWALSPMSIDLSYELGQKFETRIHRFGIEAYTAGVASIREVVENLKSPYKPGQAGSYVWEEVIQAGLKAIDKEEK